MLTLDPPSEFIAALPKSESSSANRWFTSPLPPINRLGDDKVFRWLPLVRQLPRSQRFSGLIAALKLAKHGNDLTSVLLTAFAARELESPPESEFFSARVDRETSVRLIRIPCISMT